MTMTAELEAADILLCLAKVGQNLEQTVKDQDKDDPTDIHDIINGAMQVKNEKNQNLNSDESLQRDDALNSRERKSRYNLRNLTKVIYKEANGDQQVQMATPKRSKHQNTNTTYTEWFTSMAAEAQELLNGKLRQHAAKNRALMSAEKRASRAEYMRKYKIAYRASGRDRSRIPRSAMSEEERALARERARQSRARLIARRGVEAFREQHRGYENRYREKMSEEKRIQLTERSLERNRARNVLLQQRLARGDPKAREIAAQRTAKHRLWWQAKLAKETAEEREERLASRRKREAQNKASINNQTQAVSYSNKKGKKIANRKIKEEL